MMKSISGNIGSFSIAGISVFQMSNFNPLTLAFWTTLTGIALWCIVAGIVGEILYDGIKSKLNQWHGTGQTRSGD